MTHKKKNITSLAPRYHLSADQLITGVSGFAAMTMVMKKRTRRERRSCSTPSAWEDKVGQ